MNILHLPTSVGGNAWGLSQAERTLGHNSQVLIADRNPYKFKANIEIPFPPQTEGKNQSLSISEIQYKIHKIRTFLKIRSRYDILHFNFGRTLFDLPRLGIEHLDLPFYSKKSNIVVTYNGCDARQKDWTMNHRTMSPCHHDNCYGGWCNDVSRDIQKRKRITKFANYARHFFALNPDLMHFLPEDKASFMPYTIHNQGLMNDGKNNPGDNEKITIVHAPTEPVAKGTPYLLKAIENLKKKHKKSFDFILIQNMPHHEAMKMYQKADLIIDQLLVGWYGAFAIEAMSMGKAVASFIREEDLIFIPDKMADNLKDSMVNISIETIESKIEYFIEDPSALGSYMKNGYKYAKNWHNPIKIAKDALTYYQS